MHSAAADVLHGAPYLVLAEESAMGTKRYAKNSSKLRNHICKSCTSLQRESCGFPPFGLGFCAHKPVQ